MWINQSYSFSRLVFSCINFNYLILLIRIWVPPLNKAVSAYCSLPCTKVLLSNSVKKMHTATKNRKWNHCTGLAYEMKVSFPLGTIGYHKNIRNTTSGTVCSDHKAPVWDWKRSFLQKMHLKDQVCCMQITKMATVTILSAYLTLTDQQKHCELQRTGEHSKLQGQSSSFLRFSVGFPSLGSITPKRFCLIVLVPTHVLVCLRHLAKNSWLRGIVHTHLKHSMCVTINARGEYEVHF